MGYLLSGFIKYILRRFDLRGLTTILENERSDIFCRSFAFVFIHAYIYLNSGVTISGATHTNQFELYVLTYAILNGIEKKMIAII